MTTEKRKDIAKESWLDELSKRKQN